MLGDRLNDQVNGVCGHDLDTVRGEMSDEVWRLTSTHLWFKVWTKIFDSVGCGIWGAVCIYRQSYWEN